MSDLSEFLLARIAEDEAAARAATPGPWLEFDCSDATFNSANQRGWWWVWRKDALPHYGGVIEMEAHPPNCVIGECQITDAREGEREQADAAHIARHDPARVLAECDSKRRIVEHEKITAAGGDYIPAIETTWTLRVLALPYADHPDYRNEWRP